jgi:ABC-2 type transport system permease protein
VLKLFWRLVWVSLKQQTTYRAAMLAGLATNLFFGLLRLALLKGLYQDQGVVNNLTLSGSITYIAISQASIAFLFIFGTTDLMKSVASGDVAADLLKPVRLFTMWMAKDLGRALVNLVTRGIFFMLIFQFFSPLVWPQKFSQWILFFISILLGWLVSYAWRFLVNLAAFWTPDAIGVGRAAFAVSQLFSGFMLPLQLFPKGVQQVFQLTPFPSIINTPVEIWLGLTRGADIWLALGLQVFWLAALTWLCQVTVRAGVRRLVIQGG